LKGVEEGEYYKRNNKLGHHEGISAVLRAYKNIQGEKYL
jgi:hypothetical protein